MPKKLKPALIAVVVVCVLGALIAMASRDRTVWPDLMSQAKFVSPISGDPYQNAEIWVNDQQILMSNMIMPGSGSSGETLVNVDTGAQMTLTGITNSPNFMLISASPDGQWLLWYPYPTGTALGNAEVTRLDGSKTVKFDDEMNGLGTAWMPDSRHWIHCTMMGSSSFGGKIRDCDVDTGTCRDITVPGLTGYEKQVVADKSGNLVTTGMSNDYSASGYSGPFSITRINIAGTIPSATVTPVTPPKDPGSQSGQAIISPDGTRILWTTRVFHVAEWQIFMSRILHRGFVSLGGASDEDFYVSNIDGSNMHPLGRISNSFAFGQATWSPDSHRIALIINNRLAIVNVP